MSVAYVRTTVSRDETERKGRFDEEARVQKRSTPHVLAGGAAKAPGSQATTVDNGAGQNPQARARRAPYTLTTSRQL